MRLFVDVGRTTAIDSAIVVSNFELCTGTPWPAIRISSAICEATARAVCCLPIGHIGPDGKRKHRGHGSQSTRHNGGSDEYFYQCESTIWQRVIRLGLEKGRANETLKRCHGEINTVTDLRLSQTTY